MDESVPRVRVHSISPRVGHSSKEVVARLKRLGFENVKSPSSTISIVQADAYVAAFGN